MEGGNGRGKCKEKMKIGKKHGDMVTFSPEKSDLDVKSRDRDSVGENAEKRDSVRENAV